ncbi:MAG: CUAEP/CCAEP-tail radical SAM (seleno)protein [Actinomycetota bacterium]|jgi:radical SAM superfamily enzyme YgiQ (UPF0313 family)
MRLLLVSTYELGHQPLHLAAPAAALRAAGHEVRTLDTSVESWTREPVDWADAVAFSVPMHTAMRLAIRAAASVRAVRPELPICLYGLYATVSRDLTLGPGGVADHAIGGEYERELVAWADALAGPTTSLPAGRTVIDTGRRRPVGPPDREGLPPLDRYAHLALAGGERPVGYVEASRGCLHRCGHCPVPVIYDGRIRIVPEDVVLADIERLVETGARHITFGDPDFLNGPQHSRRIVTAMHERWPELTFDCTVKVEHILRHRELWPEFAAAGCLFVVSAFETVHEETLTRLDKGHTAADAALAVQLLREYGIEIRPSFLPFTPWTTVDEVADIVDFVAALDLIPNVDPVQYTIRLLVPQGSLLEPMLAAEGRLGPYDPERLTWTWTSEDPSVDELQTRLTALVEGAQTAGEPIARIYRRVQQTVWMAAGRQASGFCPPLRPVSALIEGRPRLTEPWFC